MDFEIPTHLKNQAFRFIPLKPSEETDKKGIIGKRPKEMNWGKENKAYNFQELPKAIEKSGGSKIRYGVMGGYGNLAGIDADHPKIQEAIEKNFPKTLKVKSITKNEDGSPKFHYYAILTKPLPEGKTIPLTNPSNPKENWGHIRWFGGQLVGPNSKLRGKTYEIIQEISIEVFETEKLLAVLSPYIQKKISQTKTSEIDLRCENIVSTSSLTDRGFGKFQGGHPFHKSSTQWDFELDRNKNTWYCFGHNTGGDALQLLAMKEGLLECHECGQGALRGNKFKQILKIAKEKYGYKEKEQPRESLTKELIPKNFNYFANLKKDNRFLVEGFLYPKTVNGIWSPPEYFKSITAMHLGMQIANGKPFLDLRTRKNPVLICDNENNEQTLRKRLMAQRRGQNIRSKKFPLWYLTSIGAIFDTQEGIEQLQNIIQEKGIKLVVFDTLHRFFSGEENSSDCVNKIYRDALKPITELDCAILYLHHTGKDGKYRGSSDLLGMLDTAWRIYRKNRKSTKFNIICEKSRQAELNDIPGEIDGDGETYTKFFSRDTESEEKEEYGQRITKLKNTRLLIQGMFAMKGDLLKRKDILTNLEMLQADGKLKKEDWSLATMKRALEWMVNHDLLGHNKKTGEYQRLWAGEAE